MYNILDLYIPPKEKKQSQQIPPYTIFCDLDGVLSNFDLGYKNLTGVATHLADLHGKKRFWEIFNTSLKYKGLTEYEYWSSLPLMDGAKQLWEFISPYNPCIITSPSKSPESQLGKLNWIKINLDPQPEDVIFKFTGKKHEILWDKTLDKINKCVLIDDFTLNTVPWEIEGGISIFHSNLVQTLDTLKTLNI
jgi:hypothetical protein